MGLAISKQLENLHGCSTHAGFRYHSLLTMREAPLSGTVNAINKNLEDDPGLVSNSPEEKGWMYKLENIDLDELEDLLSEEDYAKYLKTLQ